MAHGQAFTAVYADGGMHGISSTTRTNGCIRSAAMFCVVTVATIMETMFNMGLLAISGCRS
eukprot:6190472-Pleurochrysis_carterae.AAC.2